MSRIVGPSRHGRAKQSILFSQPEPQQQIPSYNFSFMNQDNLYNQFTPPSQQYTSPSIPQPFTESSVPQQKTSSSRSRGRGSRSQQPEQLVTDAYSNTLNVPEGFSTVSVNVSDIQDIQALNNNASHRGLSASMYDDVSAASHSMYKQNVIANMTRDVLAQAELLRQSSESENRSYESQVNAPMDTSYGAHKLNMIAAKQIVKRGSRKSADDE